MEHKRDEEEELLPQQEQEPQVRTPAQGALDSSQVSARTWFCCCTAVCCHEVPPVELKPGIRLGLFVPAGFYQWRTQLLFNVALSMLLLKHRLSQLAWTSISLVTCTALLLALDSSHESVANVTRSQHALGFAAALASFSCGLTYVLVELIFAKFPSCSSNPQQVIAWILFFSMFIPVAGLVLTGELGSIPQESQNFQHGPLAYYSTLSLR